MLSKSTVYSIRAMILLGRLEPGSYLGSRAAGERLEIPANYLGKILQSLAKKGLLTSQRGIGGGFRLAKKPDHIHLLEIVEAVTESPFLADCFWGTTKCTPEKPCVMHPLWIEAQTQMRSVLKNTTIDQLLKSTGRV